MSDLRRSAGPEPGPPRRLVVLLLVITSVLLLGLDARLGDESPVGDVRSALATVVAPVQEVLHAAAEPVQDLVDERDRAAAAARDERVAELEAEVARLTAEARVSAYARSRADQLDALLGLVSAAGYPTVPALVIAVSPAQDAERTVKIDAGTRDGVRPDLTVLCADGLVGEVISATPTTATVRLIVDPGVQVGVRVAGSAELAIARTDADAGGPDGATITVELLDPLAPLTDGAAVVTFGSADGRPYVPGVPVGELTAVDAPYGSPSRTATLDPYVDFTALDLVGVVIDTPRTDPRDLLVPVERLLPPRRVGTP